MQWSGRSLLWMLPWHFIWNQPKKWGHNTIKFVVFCTADYSSDSFLSLSSWSWKETPQLLQLSSLLFSSRLLCGRYSNSDLWPLQEKQHGWAMALVSRSISAQFNPKQITQSLYSLNLTAPQVSKVNTTPALESDLNFHALSFLSSPLTLRSHRVISVHHMNFSANNSVISLATHT